jgi:hypothetical protein
LICQEVFEKKFNFFERLGSSPNLKENRVRRAVHKNEMIVLAIAMETIEPLEQGAESVSSNLARGRINLTSGEVNYRVGERIVGITERRIIHHS